MYPESSPPQQNLLPKPPVFHLRGLATGQLEDRSPAFINASENTTSSPLLIQSHYCSHSRVGLFEMPFYLHYFPEPYLVLRYPDCPTFGGQSTTEQTFKQELERSLTVLH